MRKRTPMKLLSLLLTLCLLLTIFSDSAVVANASSTITTASNEQFHSEDIVIGDEFDIETIRNFIDVNLKLGIIDEDFFSIISNAYQENPELFAKMILDLNEKDVLHLAKGIAYDLSKTGASLPSISQNDFRSQDVFAVASKIQKQISLINIDASNSDINAIFSEQNKSNSRTEWDDLDPTYVISNVTYSKSSYTVGEVGTIYVTLSCNQASVDRTVWIKVLQLIDGKYVQKNAGNVYIPAGELSVDTSFDIQFTSQGSHYTYFWIYECQGGTLQAQDRSETAVMAYGTWRIRVALLGNRSLNGYLTLYNCRGKYITGGYCLGKSASNLPMSAINGDTPTGVCMGELTSHIEPPEKCGPHKVIILTPVSGLIKDYSYRDGFWIHGGREGVSSPSDPWYPLYPTDGCIRVSNAYQLTLETKITELIVDNHNPLGQVEIIETWYEEEDEEI